MTAPMENTPRPHVLCKFRPWRVAAEKDGRTGSYTEHHRTREMLLTGQFYCQPPRFFDDPHDGLQGARATGMDRDIDRFILHNIGAEVLDVMHRNGLSSLTQLNQASDPQAGAVIKKAARKHARRDTRVLSLSAAPFSELMWSFYADNHRGICLCFDPEHPFFAEARVVKYVSNPAEIAQPVDNEPVNDPLLYAKGEAWGWQEEWRIVWSGGDPKLIDFPKDALRTVILGEWFQVAGYNDLVNTLRCGGYKVRIMQMERLPNSFDYQFVEYERIE